MLAMVLKALRAFPFPANTSSSVPPVIFITLPKYVKDVTSSKRGNIDHRYHLLPRTAINHDGLCLIRIDFKHKFR